MGKVDDPTGPKITWKRMDIIAEDRIEGVSRDVPPSHYTFTIESFSLLLQSSIECHESCIFEAGGYKWKLVLYPKGDAERDVSVTDHVSLYLAIAETCSLPPGWEVNAVFKFFLFDQIHDKYLALGDVGGRTRRFHEMKKEWGYARFISHAILNDTSNGYVLDDTCVFGTEVFVCKSTGKGESLLMEDSGTYKFSFKFDNLSDVEESCTSEVLFAGDHQWEIELYPKGKSAGRNRSLSVYLGLNGSETLIDGDKIYVEYIILLRDLNMGRHKKLKETVCFVAPCDSWGFNEFITLEEFHDSTNGFLLKDTCIIDVEISVIGIVKASKASLEES